MRRLLALMAAVLALAFITPLPMLLAQQGAATIISTSGGGTPGGNDTEIQFNDGGSFGGDSVLTWDASTQILHAQIVAAMNLMVTPNVTESTAYDYYVIANFADGTHTGMEAPNPPVEILNGPDTLDMTHFNTLTWSAIAGATSYDIYEDDVALAKVGHVTTPGFVDNGGGSIGAFESLANTTGSVNTGTLDAGIIKLAGATQQNINVFASPYFTGVNASTVSPYNTTSGTFMLFRVWDNDDGVWRTWASTENGNGPQVVLGTSTVPIQLTANPITDTSMAGAANSPVCVDGNGRLYRGTNTVGVLSCP